MAILGGVNFFQKTLKYFFYLNSSYFLNPGQFFDYGFILNK